MVQSLHYWRHKENLQNKQRSTEGQREQGEHGNKLKVTAYLYYF